MDNRVSASDATTSTTYDEIPYESHPFPATHPTNLAAVAHLHGLNPPGLEHCRVLELGCASGGNLLPMAQLFPDMSLVGIDLSSRQIAEGQLVAHQLGLKNLRLEAANILSIDDSIGEFDYIIAHGVYSWVPPAVQHKILELCHQLLTPHGVAFVSYNTFPGWYSRGMVRDMLRFQVRDIQSPREQTRRGREFLEFLVNSVSDPKSLHALRLKEESLALEGKSDHYFFHEYLESDNEPLFFHQFLDRAREAGLKFLSEARFSEMAGVLPPSVRKQLQEFAPDFVSREQTLDFLRNRTFRRTLLCRDDAPSHLIPDASAIRSLFFTAHAAPVNPALDTSGDKVEQFRTAEGVTLSTNNPMMKTALAMLYSVWPSSVSFDELWSSTVYRLTENGQANPLLYGTAQDRPDPSVMLPLLLQCTASDLVEIHAHRRPVTLDISERPLTTPYARWQAASSEVVTTLTHHIAPISSFDRLILRCLDGRTDRGKIKELIMPYIEQNPELLSEMGETNEAMNTDAAVSRQVDEGLQRIARHALLWDRTKTE